MKEKKKAEKRTVTTTSLVIESSVVMTGVEDMNPLRSSAMSMAEPPTSGWTIILPFLEDPEPVSEQTTLPPSYLPFLLRFNTSHNHDSSRSR